jgi:DNA-directed RNA polymerase specialized sigma subunit
MYIEHPYYYDGKYYAHVDGEMIEISREVAYAMNNFYKTSRPKCIEKVNDNGEVERKVREIHYGGNVYEELKFPVREYEDPNGDVERIVIGRIDHKKIHDAIGVLDEEERMIIYAIYFEDMKQVDLARIMGVSRQVLSYKISVALNKMRADYRKNIF